MSPKAKKEEVITHGHKGVYRSRGMWRSRIWDGDNELYLGHYSEPGKAAQAYDKACISLRGFETASREGLNFTPQDYVKCLSQLTATSFQETVVALLLVADARYS